MSMMLTTKQLLTCEDMREHSEKAWDIYASLREELERKHWGEYIIINPNNKDYFIGKNHFDTLNRACAVYPNTVFYTIRIGYKAAFRR